MVGKIQPKIPNDDEFSNQYSSGVNQYGTLGANSPDQFQSYMNDGMTQGVDGSTSSKSPMEMMAEQQNLNFGPPTATQGNTSFNNAAPENFGPPGIAQTAQGESSFGAPGFQAPPNQNSQPGQKGGSSNSNQNLPPQVGAPTTTAPSSPPSNNNLNSNQNLGPGGTAKPAKPTPTSLVKKKSYKDVENMEMNAMMQNAITHMKIKDPDPTAWN